MRTQKAPVDLFISVAHAQVTADTTGEAFFVNHPTKRFRVDKVQYINPTGLANHATDFFNLKIMQGAVVVANWSTETGQQGAIGAGETENLVLSATDADLVLEPGEKLHFVLDESGAATLPAGTFFIWGRLIPNANQ